MCTLVALVAVVLSSFSLGLHAGTEAVGQPSLQPTTIYFSQHTAGGDEEHLHAETGIESVLCLACFLSLWNQTLLEGSPALLGASETSDRLLANSLFTPLASRAINFSSRAPPRA